MVIRVHLCDASGHFRAGIRELLESHADIRVVGESGDCGPLAVAAPCDVLVLDAALLRGGDGGPSAALERHARAVPVVVLSLQATIEHVLHAFAAGARAYVLKDCAPHEIGDAVRAVHARRLYMSPKLAATLAAAIPAVECTWPEREVEHSLATCHDSPTEHGHGKA